MTIPNELRQLVSRSVKVLGQAFQDIHGKYLFQEIEDLRVKMKGVRGQSSKVVSSTLDEVYEKLRRSKSEDLHHIAKSFALMLELINTCETAYRSFRLQEYRISSTVTPQAIIYVFTSHPTEARSQAFLKLMREIEELLIESLKTDFEKISARLLYLLRLAIRLSLANNRRPQVKDEMEQVFHTVLDEEILKEQVELHKAGINVSFRTWVGGDKDGNPKVGSTTMVESWTLSRKKLLVFINEIIQKFEIELKLVDDGQAVLRQIQIVKKNLRALNRINKEDGKKVHLFKKNFKRLQNLSEKKFLSSPSLQNLTHLIYLYPALVLPLEIREDSELIHRGVKNKREPISRMLNTLREVSKGMDPKWYVRGFVISMCQSSEDILAALKILKREFNKLAIPIVPLFENEKGLKNSIEILEKAFKSFPFNEIHKKNWGSRFEVMVGYSDSSKENGVLPARLMIEKALFKMEDFLIEKRFVPVFFHGSGGSTSRGGGTVHEQISWWPQSALNIFKVTIQGEMVQRNFNNSLIMRSQVGKILDGYGKFNPKSPVESRPLNSFTEKIQQSYRTLVSDFSFQELIMTATPYDYLNLLKIGSRPSKRSGKGKFSLRAIPWILCWTQTRLLLPVWWGTGSAWKMLTSDEKKSVIKYYENSPLMQSYVKNLGFTLAKVEIGVWNFHLEHSRLSQEEKKNWMGKIYDEFNLSVRFFNEISNEDNFTWFRPWLGESIYFRSSMIHPLNVIQKLALERKDNILLRETVTGIACGMLTTG